MKSFAVALALFLFSGSVLAGPGCNRLFVKFYFTSGGNDSWDLMDSGGNGDFSDVTGRVRFYSNKGVWTLVGSDGSTWTRQNPCDPGGGFVLVTSGNGPVPTRVEVK